MTPYDVAFGRLAAAKGLVDGDALRAAAASGLGPGRTLKDALVGGGLVTPAQAAQLDAAVRAGSGQLATAAEAAAPTLRLPARLPSASASTLEEPPPAPAQDHLTTVLGTSDAASITGAGGGLPVARTPEPGDVIDERFELRAVLGRGGMGAVFRARDRLTGVDVALKVMLSLLDPDAEGRRLQRFQREAEAVARVDSHPGIVRIRALGLHAGRLPYVAMDLVVGQDLRARGRELGPLPPEEALRLVELVARAVHHCHARGILHRDLKPANILVNDDDGQPRVTDFGLALDASAERLTRTGESLGTPAYMAPEQAEGDRSRIDERADVYGLGAILYELVAGRAPFTGDALQVLKKVLVDAPEPLDRLRQDLPAGLDAICQKALSKERLWRYPTAAAFADDCARLRRGEPVAARPPSGWARARAALRRRDPRALAPIAVAAVLLAGAAAAWSLRPPQAVSALRAALPGLGSALERGDLLARDERSEALASTLGACLPATLPFRVTAPFERPEALARVARLETLAALAPDDPDPLVAALGAEVAPHRDELARLVLRVAVHDGAWPLRRPHLPEGRLDAPAELLVLEALHAMAWGPDRAAPVTSAALPLLEAAARAGGEPARFADEVRAQLAAIDADATAAMERDADAILAGLDLDSGRRPQVAWSNPPAQADRLGAWRRSAWERARSRALAGLVGRALARAGERNGPERRRHLLRLLVDGRLSGAVEGRASPEERAASRAVLEAVLLDCRELDAAALTSSTLDVLALIDACIDTSQASTTLQDEAADYALLAVQAWSQGNELPPPELVLFFPRLGQLPTGHASQQLLRRGVQDGTFDRWAERFDTGDAWLITAEAHAQLDFDGEEAESPAVDDRPWQAMAKAAERRANAVGAALSPERRALLRLPPVRPLKAPLTPMWLAHSLGRLLVGVGYVEGQRSSPSREVLDACLDELERVRAEGTFPDQLHRVKFLDDAGLLAQGMADLHRFGDAWAADRLRRAVDWFRAALDAGWELERRARQGSRSAREGSLVALTSDGDLDRAVALGIVRPAEGLVGCLVALGRAVDARAVAADVRGRFPTGVRPHLAQQVVFWEARAALAQGDAPGVEAAAEGLLAAGRAGLDGDEKRAEQLISMARGLRAELGLSRGEVEAARRERDALLAELPGRSLGADWWWKTPLEALR